MEKHLNKIVIAAVIIILVFLYLIVDMLIDRNKSNTQLSATNTPVETEYSTEDYVISQSVQIYPDINTELGEHMRILGTVESIIFENQEVIGFNITDYMGNFHEIMIGDMHLISMEYDDANEVILTFRTGGWVRVTVGDYVYMYKGDDDSYYLDERVQFGGDIQKTVGTITGFEFAPMQHQQGHIMLSNILFDGGTGQTEKLPVISMNIQSILSTGELTVFFMDNVVDDNAYSVKAGDNFSIQAIFNDGSTQEYRVGSKINLQMSSKKEYWEPERNIDVSRQKTTVQDIVFGFSGRNISSIDYIVLKKDDGTIEYLTLLQTQALYGKPLGNYQRTFTGEGNDLVLSDATPHADWEMELYYNNMKLLVKLGSEVWITKNSDDIYVFDYEYTYSVQ